MGPGSHVGFPISAKNKNLVYDHPMNISAKFDSNEKGHSDQLNALQALKQTVLEHHKRFTEETLNHIIYIDKMYLFLPLLSRFKAS
jgi:hypothetical protein